FAPRAIASMLRRLYPTRRSKRRAVSSTEVSRRGSRGRPAGRRGGFDAAESAIAGGRSAEAVADSARGRARVAGARDRTAVDTRAFITIRVVTYPSGSRGVKRNRRARRRPDAAAEAKKGKSNAPHATVRGGPRRSTGPGPPGVRPRGRPQGRRDARPEHLAEGRRPPAARDPRALQEGRVPEPDRRVAGRQVQLAPRLQGGERGERGQVQGRATGRDPDRGGRPAAAVHPRPSLPAHRRQGPAGRRQDHLELLLPDLLLREHLRRIAGEPGRARRPRAAPRRRAELRAVRRRSGRGADSESRELPLAGAHGRHEPSGPERHGGALLALPRSREARLELGVRPRAAPRPRGEPRESVRRLPRLRLLLRRRS